jgi:N utilization substance protein B
MASNRHLGRIVALQTLYEYEFRVECEDASVTIANVLERNLDRYREAIGDREFVEKVVNGVVEDMKSLDETIQPIVPEWPISQIARVDRMILRMAVYELQKLGDVVPPKVAINEAVELAKAFGSDNSSKFVNGVLGTAYRALIGGSDDADAKV